MATYFADPYSSYQRGGNENRNGVIRRYLPKRTRIEPSMADAVQAIVDETDNRPMRVHAGRGIRRRTARINQRTRALHFSIDNGRSSSAPLLCLDSQACVVW